MKTVIFCGGKGTRIRDVRSDVPKPMVEISGTPILLHLMQFYARAGFSDFVLCLGYKGDVIREFFTRNTEHSVANEVRVRHDEFIEVPTSPTSWNVALIETGLETLTGGRLRRAQPYIGNESFMLTYGDGLSDINLQKLVAHHKRLGKLLTVSGVRPPSRFGELSVEGDTVVGFNEKPQASSGLISGGFFVAEPKIFSYLGDTDNTMLEREPMELLVVNRAVGVFRHDGFWQCMDTYRDWEFLNDLASKGDAPWLI